MLGFLATAVVPLVMVMGMFMVVVLLVGIVFVVALMLMIEVSRGCERNLVKTQSPNGNRISTLITAVYKVNNNKHDMTRHDKCRTSTPTSVPAGPLNFAAANSAVSPWVG